MSELNTIAIVGANLAGGRAAESLRERGFDGRIVLVGAEPDRPYERPPLSKPAFSRGEVPPEKVYLRPPEYYDEQRIELRLGARAVALDPRARSVMLEGGDELRYDKLLIATGTGVRRLAVPGVELPGVHYLRTIRDAEAIGAELAPAERVVVLGDGSTIPCDLCVVGVGVAPNVDWLTGSGVEIENGVVVDERCQTSVPDV